MSLHSNLLCRSGCGFYGLSEWEWYCSKCWRENQRKHGSPTKSSRFLSSLSPDEAPKDGAASGELKRSPKKGVLPKNRDGMSEKRQTLDKNIKQLFGARMTSKESPEKSPKSRPKPSPSRKIPELPKEATEVSKELALFLNKKKLERQAISDVSKNVKSMIDKIQRVELASVEHVDELSERVQDLYSGFQKRLETLPVYKKLTDEDIQKILDLTEKYIMICCYKQLFCPSITSDEDKDLELQNRIRSLNWMSTEHLNCAIDEFSQDVRDLLYQAINDMLEIDGKMAPQDKMASLVKCSKNIFEILKLSNESPASADDFLPCLIYICLKANPPRIQSNINFITRFCNENKIRMGEMGYFFANLCCAISFIENLTAESVNMDPEEFESYTSGTSVPLESWRSNLLMCDGLQKMSQNLKVLSDLKSQQEQILKDAKKLEEEMAKFQTDINTEVDAVLQRTQYTIKNRTKEPVNLDDLANPEDDLPAPLLPTSHTETTSIEPKKEPFNPTLEDYLSTSDSMSLLSLDMSSNAGAPLVEQHETSMISSSEANLSSYIGFSAQSSAIPSISCDSALKAKKTSSSSAENVVSTASSSPMMSAPTSPDDEDLVTPKISSSSESEEDNGPTAAKVLSGIFETFDNLL